MPVIPVFFLDSYMKQYKKHIFICENVRGEEDSQKSCGRSDSANIRQKFKSRLKELNLSTEIRANAAGCLGQCKHGPITVVYPEGIWYKKIKLDDVEEIVQSHLINDKPVDRLIFKNED